MTTIYKYILSIEDYQSISLPESAAILSIQNQNESVVLYAQVETTAPTRKINIYMYGTGSAMVSDSLLFLGTVMLANGRVVFHIFTDLSTMLPIVNRYVEKHLNEVIENKIASHEYVDLGLPSGTLWATMNIGAQKVTDYGDYFAWGETETKEVYSWKTCNYCQGEISTITKYCTNSNDGMVDNKVILDTYDDVATVNWGENWRMPTFVEVVELRSNCYWVWTENYNNSGKAGYIVYKAKSDSDKGQIITRDSTTPSSYSLTDAHIFLPCAGFRVDKSRYGAGSYGDYWSSSVYEDDCNITRGLGFDSSGAHYHSNYRYGGRSIRAIYNKK